MAAARAPHETAAERMRKPREVMEYALRHQLTLPEAERLLARQRYLALMARAKFAGHATPRRAPALPPTDAPWMLRD